MTRQQGLELACGLIVVGWLVWRARRDARPWGVVWRWWVLACAGWVGEESCIHAYEFYAYSGVWSGFVDRVPVWIALIWPVVILSAWDLARWLMRGRSAGAVAWCGAGIVWADAALIEPVAVNSGLWEWFVGGPFGVPVVGVFGWGCFAWGAVYGLEVAERRGRVAVGWWLPLAWCATHAGVLCAWWGGLRWVGGAGWEAWVVGGAWCVGLVCALRAWGVRGAGGRVWVWARGPGALFFFVLLALDGREAPWLVGYALAFAPWYWALLAPGGVREEEGGGPIE